MTKAFRKKNVLLRSGKKEKKATISIYRKKYRWYRIKQASRIRHLEKTGQLSTL